MKPSHYEQLYGKRRWIYLGLLIGLVAAGAGLWKQLGRLWASPPPEAPAIAGESSRNASLTATTPQALPQSSPQGVPALDHTHGETVVSAAMDDLMVRVRYGNCLWRLAASHCGTGFRWPEIYQVNQPPIVDPNLIYPGQTLRIPCGKRADQ
jgi:nucleoid-associated protein YgaU